MVLKTLGLSYSAPRIDHRAKFLLEPLRPSFYNALRNDFQAKLVFRPLSPEHVRILPKKIPVTKILNLQLTTCLGGDGVSQIRNKTTLGLCPGVDFQFGWRADYVLPEITGGLGTNEPLFNMNSGQLQALLDRVEAILSYQDTV
ncbi:hypothetical protein EUGRSUZ_C03513 [Eucalyptus grandis]|uniref:Uncharacterized protein n=2 Tax=Eucalyptus grandis TaxID=71139 RepID=A0ACC3LK08_EUCGR|nr:hypothetical protein EUGRSUZ_C03513 [Eucalyptus grandis]